MKRRAPTSRRGLLLLAVLVVIAMLSFSAYEFSHWISVEAEMSLVLEDQVQARYLAESGVELIRALGELRAKGREVPLPLNYAELFEGISVPLGESGATASFGGTTESGGRLAVFVAEPSGDRLAALTPGEEMLRFGVEGEAGRLAINHWSATNQEGLRQVLLSFPEATPELVDSVLDWMDADDTKREGGAEREDYDKVDPPIHPRNGPIESVEELLVVRGMTRAILWGEDENRNGQLDPNEDDGEESFPPDNEDGKLDRGWGPLLTLSSREPQTTWTGEPLIDVNGPDLPQLYAQIRNRMGEAWARFIIAYRVLGTPTAKMSLASTDVSRFHVGGLLELVDAEVTGTWEKKPVSVRSPLLSSAENFRVELLKAFENLRVGANTGRIDLSSAPEVVLGMVAEFTEEEKKLLLERRPSLALPRELTADQEKGNAEGDFLSQLVTSPEFPVAKLRAAEGRWTWRSSVVRCQSVGFFDEKKASYRLEVVLDLATRPPTVLSVRRMDRWGAGISLERLGRGAEGKPLPALGEQGPAIGPSS